MVNFLKFGGIDVEGVKARGPNRLTQLVARLSDGGDSPLLNENAHKRSFVHQTYECQFRDNVATRPHHFLRESSGLYFTFLQSVSKPYSIVIASSISAETMTGADCPSRLRRFGALKFRLMGA